MRGTTQSMGSLGATLVVCIVCTVMTTGARADTVAIMSDTDASEAGLGQYTGSVCYDAVLGELLVSLTNTSGLTALYLTGFVFNIEGDAEATSLTSSYALMTLVTDEPAPPFGTYDAGAALGEDWNGGGPPWDGIGDGETGEFSFQITGADASSLTAMDFLTGGFVARFRGEPDSDKVPVTLVPLPAPVALGALGLVGALVGSRRVRRLAAP